MINYEITFIRTGYDKRYFDKYPKSNRKVYVLCDNCKKARWVKFTEYCNLCEYCR